MEHDFWHKKWSDGKIGFHQAEINPYLQSYWQRIGLEGDEKVFVPLCGKSSDMLWLREQGHEVLGVELNASACEAFFSENDAESVIVEGGDFTSYSIDGIDVLCGDFFNLTQEHLSGVTAVYDRAALIALPKEMRSKYVDHLQKVLSPAVNILLVTLEFDEETGPPFSVSADEVEALFGERFEIKCLDRVQPDDPRDAGRHEVTWLLQGKGD